VGGFCALGQDAEGMGSGERQAIATFHCDAVAPRCAFADQSRIVAGDQGGRVYFLTFEQ